MKMIKTIKSLPLAAATIALLAAVPLGQGTLFESGAVFAQEQKQAETRKVPAMTLGFHKQLEKAQEALDLEDLPTAEEILTDALDSKKINDYERATVWQMRAIIYYQKNDTLGTIDAYKNVLRYKDSIPVAQEMQILYYLAQLYFSEDNYKESLRYANIWESQIDPSLIGVSHRVFFAQLHYTLQNYEMSLEYIYKAIETAKAVDTVEVSENWYNLALSAHWELNQFTKVRDVLEILLINWPKPLYWIQLAGVYQELGDEKTSYSLTEAAYKQGFLDDKEQQLVTVAQIQIARNAPIKCAWILERGFKEKRISDNAKNMRTLGQCYMQANEYRKAVDPLKKAAADEADATLWLQIGQVYMQLDDMKGASDAFDKTLAALEKDKSKKANEQRFSATMMKGQALIELKEYSDARKLFATATKIAQDKKDKKAVRQWLSYLKNEEAREKMLTGD